MDELLAYVRAQLDERERVARAAIKSLACGCHPGEFPGAWTVVDGRVQTEVHQVTGGEGWPAAIEDEVAEHIALNDPVSVLADVAAKRAILDEHPRFDLGDDGPCCRTCGSDDGAGSLEGDWPCRTLLLLAQAYAGREGWREEWRP